MKLKIEVTQKGELTEAQVGLVNQAVFLAQVLATSYKAEPLDVSLTTPFGDVSIKGDG